MRYGKVILVAATVMIATGTGLLSIVGGSMIWVSVIMAGIFRDGFMAILMTTIIELEGVGARYAGTAMGFVMLFSRFGGLISPPLGNALAEIDFSLPFAFWSMMGVMALVGFSSIMEKRSLLAIFRR